VPWIHRGAEHLTQMLLHNSCVSHAFGIRTAKVGHRCANVPERTGGLSPVLQPVGPSSLKGRWAYCSLGTDFSLKVKFQSWFLIFSDFCLGTNCT